VFGTNAGATQAYWNMPPLADGSQRAATGTGASIETLVQANVEPDIDCDGKGDETQDPSLTDGPCKSLPKQKLTAKKKQKLKSSSIRETVDKASSVKIIGKKLKTSTTSLAANAATSIKLAYSKKGKKSLKKALAAGKKPKVNLTATATDTFGNVSTATVSFKLKG
jgi:hypothetical protein